MPKALVITQSLEVNGGQLHATADFVLTDNSGKALQLQYPFGRQVIPYTGSASALIDAIEARAIALAAGAGVTIVATDVTIVGAPVQGA